MLLTHIADRIEVCTFVKSNDANYFVKGFFMHFELVKMYWQRKRKIYLLGSFNKKVCHYRN